MVSRAGAGLQHYSPHSTSPLLFSPFGPSPAMDRRLQMKTRKSLRALKLLHSIILTAQANAREDENNHLFEGTGWGRKRGGLCGWARWWRIGRLVNSPHLPTLTSTLALSLSLPGDVLGISHNRINPLDEILGGSGSNSGMPICCCLSPCRCCTSQSHTYTHTHTHTFRHRRRRKRQCGCERLCGREESTLAPGAPWLRLCMCVRVPLRNSCLTPPALPSSFRECRFRRRAAYLAPWPR